MALLWRCYGAAKALLRRYKALFTGGLRKKKSLFQIERSCRKRIMTSEEIAAKRGEGS